MEENEELKEAVEKLDSMSDDEMMQRIADARLMAIMDKKAEIRMGYNEGKKEGEKIGKIEGKIEAAKKMLEEGIPLETVIRITELAEEEIKNIK